MMYKKMSEKGLEQELVDARIEVKSMEGKLEYARGSLSEIEAEIDKRKQGGE